MRKFCDKISCKIVIIPHNKTAKYFISNKYNSWLANEVPKQLRAAKAAVNFKVSLKLFVIKPLHAKWTLLKMAKKSQ